mmetsp:Transcript_30835/g.93301  ORF Transcript_30835/g.93301 Transcript_30835/m.93301 type:complete len:205 (-) Transcript_30835:164-778(-)
MLTAISTLKLHFCKTSLATIGDASVNWQNCWSMEFFSWSVSWREPKPPGEPWLDGADPPSFQPPPWPTRSATRLRILSKGDLKADVPVSFFMLVPWPVIFCDNSCALFLSWCNMPGSPESSTIALALWRMPPPTSRPSSITRCCCHCWTRHKSFRMPSMARSLPCFSKTSSNVKVFWIRRQNLSLLSLRTSQHQLKMLSQSLSS